MWIRIVLASCALLTGASANKFQIDYRYDTGGFFSAEGNPEGAAGAAQARAALQAAADRWGAMIDQPLGAVSLADDASDVRIGFTHPGTHQAYEVSAAESSASDSLASTRPADEYRGAWSIPADTFIIYVGGADIASAGFGGTGTGLNYGSVFDDPDGVHNRGFNVGFGSLPVWGGAITFNNSSAVNWHFDHTTPAPASELDFYSTALHEIGHTLGLNTGFDEWSDLVSGGYFNGANAVAAYNADNGASLAGLLVQNLDDHWEDGRYKSLIFPAGNPNLVGTVGEGKLQDLLMEPRADYSYPALRRFEVTNVEVGALQDLGWSTISPDGQPATLAIESITRDAAGAITIAWASATGASYTVQTSLDAQTWSDVTPAVDADAGVESTSWTDGAAGFSDPNPPSVFARAKFYRVRQN